MPADSARLPLAALVASLGFTGFFLSHVSHRYADPYPPMTASLKTPDNELPDVGGVALGLRRLAADLAWIQTLQYYGTSEIPGDEEGDINGGGHYPKFLTYCERAVGIDPYFTDVYYYCGGSLGWNLNRLPEAEQILKEGIAQNPAEWRLPQYLAGLAYQKNHDVANLIKFLESIVQDPKCPLLMKALLANIYKKQRLFDKALRLWEVMYASGDPVYQQRAIEHVQEIQRLRRTPTLTK